MIPIQNDTWIFFGLLNFHPYHLLSFEQGSIDRSSSSSFLLYYIIFLIIKIFTLVYKPFKMEFTMMVSAFYPIIHYTLFIDLYMHFLISAYFVTFFFFFFYIFLFFIWFKPVGSYAIYFLLLYLILYII